MKTKVATGSSAGELPTSAQAAGEVRSAARSAPVERARVAGVPFFAQRDYECGPAALAMAMSHAGVPVTPETLVPEVWLPARRGALRIDACTPRGYLGRPSRK